VEQGTVLGRTGKTGLAGGDHLHFTTLVRACPSTPRSGGTGLDPRPGGGQGGTGRLDFAGWGVRPGGEPRREAAG